MHTTAMQIIDGLTEALGHNRDITHELFPVGATDWLALGDDIASFRVLDSRPGRITVAVTDTPERTVRRYAPRPLAKAVLDA